ncbi:MAG: hypothetical protein VB980_04100, partial [Opitutales bacterium]
GALWINQLKAEVTGAIVSEALYRDLARVRHRGGGQIDKRNQGQARHQKTNQGCYTTKLHPFDHENRSSQVKK